MIIPYGNTQLYKTVYLKRKTDSDITLVHDFDTAVSQLNWYSWQKYQQGASGLNYSAGRLDLMDIPIAFHSGPQSALSSLHSMVDHTLSPKV